MNHLRGTYINSMFLNEMTINEVAKEITYNTKKGFGIESKGAAMYWKLYK